MSAALDTIIRAAAEEFLRAVCVSHWWGREREAISLFAFGYLQRRCTPGSVLFDPTQIAIEACVPGPPALNKKGRVNKDLVIWPKPGMTLWNDNRDASNKPLAVMEWKVFRTGTKPAAFSRYDLDWLLKVSESDAAFIGYAVWFDLRDHRLALARVQKGDADERWLALSAAT